MTSSRSTTSTAARSMSRGGSPSWSIGCRRPSTRLSTPKTIDAWAAAIAAAADALTTTSERDAWQRAELDRHPR